MFKIITRKIQIKTMKYQLLQLEWLNRLILSVGRKKLKLLCVAGRNVKLNKGFNGRNLIVI